jgi:hypothetical protein
MKNTVGTSHFAFATVAFTALLSVSSVAFGGTAVDFAPLPEPETLSLLAIGAVALIVLRWSRRK